MRERGDVGFADGGRCGEVKGLERLAGGQPSLGEMAGDPACGPLGKFVLAQGREEAGRAPALAVGAFGGRERAKSVGERRQLSVRRAGSARQRASSAENRQPLG